MVAIPTVFVRTGDGQECVINESDFDDALHTRLDSSGSDDPQPVDESAEIKSLLNGTVAEISHAIESIDRSSSLNALAAAESRGKSRVGVMRALKERRAGLED